MYKSFHATVPSQQIRFMYEGLPWPRVSISWYFAKLHCFLHLFIYLFGHFYKNYYDL